MAGQRPLIGAVLLLVLVFGVGLTGCSEDGSETPDTGNVTDQVERPADVTTTDPGDNTTTPDQVVEPDQLSPDAGDSATPLSDVIPGDAPVTMEVTSEDIAITDIQGEITLEEWLEANNIRLLEEEEDGAEAATEVTGENGRAAFYSDTHKALVEVLAEDDESSPLAGMRVTARVYDTDNAIVFIVDPNEERMPVYYFGPLKDGDLGLDSDEQLSDEGVDFEFDPEDESPFPGKPFTLVEINVSMFIKATLKAALISVIGSIMKKWVKNFCLFFKPLHENACQIAGLVAKYGTEIALGGVSLLFEGGGAVSAGQLTGFAVDQLIGYGCGDVLGAVLTAWGPAPWAADNAAITDQNQGLYKSAVWKFNYLLWLADSQDTPPLNPLPGGFNEEMAKNLNTMALMRPMVLTDFYIAYQPESAALSEHLDEKSLVKTVFAGVKEATTIWQEYIKTMIDIQSLTLTYKELWIDNILVAQEFHLDYFHFNYTEKGWKPKGFGKGVECALFAAVEVVGKLFDVAAQDYVGEQTFQTHLITNDQLKLMNTVADAIYAEYWGGSIPAPQCLPDIWEPNDTWQTAPTATNFGELVVINDMMLNKGGNVGGLDIPDDTDWFALPVMGIFSKVQAGVGYREPSGDESNCAAAEGSVCVQLHWYSDLVELMDAPPIEVGGEHCGLLEDTWLDDPSLETEQYLLAPVTGETGARIMVRIRHSGAASANIPYKLYMYGYL